MSKVMVMDHPLIQHKIGLIRKKETGTKDFRETISEIAMMICYEATRHLELADVQIETPICSTTVKEIKGRKMAIVPILRAGLGMVDGALKMIPAAKIGHIGLYRDPETLKPVEYYCKLPADCAEREVFVVDPMLATGGSSVAAIRMLKEKGCKKIHFLCIIAAPEGVKAMQEAHPDADQQPAGRNRTEYYRQEPGNFRYAGKAGAGEGDGEQPVCGDEAAAALSLP